MDSRRLSRIRRYSGAQIRECIDVVYGAITLYGPPFQSGSTIKHFCNSVKDPVILLFGPTTPIMQRLPAWHIIGLASSAFARHY